MGAATFGEPKDNRAGIRNQTRTHTQRGIERILVAADQRLALGSETKERGDAKRRGRAQYA